MLFEPIFSGIAQDIREGVLSSFDPTRVLGLAAWYDPSDLDTMYRGADGITPVTTAGDPVGLILDKSKQRGPENHDDPTFQEPSGWSTGAGWIVEVGVARIVDPSASGPLLREIGTLVEVGKTYEVTVTVESNTGSFGFSGYVPGEDVLPTLFNPGETGTKTMFITVTSGNQIALRIAGTGTGEVRITEFSVKERPGNHLTQPTAAARPTYQTDGTLHWLQFDGVDDNLEGNSRFGLSVNPAMTVSSALRPAAYDNLIERIWYLGEVGGAATGTISGALGINGMSWRHNNGYSEFGSLPSGTDAVLTHIRAEGDLYGDERLFRDGVELSRTASSGDDLAPTNASEGFRLFANNVAADVLGGRLYAITVYETTLADAERSSTEAYLAQKAGIA